MSAVCSGVRFRIRHTGPNYYPHCHHNNLRSIHHHRKSFETQKKNNFNKLHLTIFTMEKTLSVRSSRWRRYNWSQWRVRVRHIWHASCDVMTVIVRHSQGLIDKGKELSVKTCWSTYVDIQFSM